jgi:uncharacterized protein
LSHPVRAALVIRRAVNWLGMDPSDFNPHSVDIAAFARRGEAASGALALTGFGRLCGEAHPEARPDPADEVLWKANAEARSVRAGGTEAWLHLHVDAHLSLVCQRCLQPVAAALHFDRSFRFVADEKQAAAIDADIEEDVLVLSRNFDLVELIEDELLLALPLVPRHEICPHPLTGPTDPVAFDERINPFDVLSELKIKRKPAPN